MKSLFRPFTAWAAGIGLALTLGRPRRSGAEAGRRQGAFHTGKYRDLFAEQGHSPAETKAKIDKAFQQLFHGDARSERVYFEAGSNANGPLAYMTDWANNDARTEGMSYGMMIAVQMDKKHEFDALWNWSNTYMLITDPKNPNVGYFAWSMNTDGTPRSTGPAPDGEEYYAMALLFAARRWGNGQGIYNYQAAGRKDSARHAPSSGADRDGAVPDSSGRPAFRDAMHSPSPSSPARTIRNASRPKPTRDRAEGRRQDAPRGAAAMRRFGGGPDPRPSTAGPMLEEEHYMVRFVPDVGAGQHGRLLSSASIL